MADRSRTITHGAQTPPERGPRHVELTAFLGDWRAEGKSYGGPDQDPANPKANAEVWQSTHTATWHTGEFFLVQDERATTDGKPFDTMSYLGVDPATGDCFAQTFENHGFERRYRVTQDGPVWKFDGEHERATITFSQDGRTQDIVWEWKPHDAWLPLCDRTATRIISGQARA